MSKIQKAIRKIQKQARAESVTDQTVKLGKLVESPPDEVLRRIEVDRKSLSDAGFIAPEDEERLIVDQYRQIKQPLIAHAFGKHATKVANGHLILITSALGGDGKTFSCINLALSLAREQDRSVLLVDADIAKAHVSSLFGLARQKGLMDVLEQGSRLECQDVIVSTDVAGLSVMPAGQMHVHATELLSSNRMERMIQALTAQDPDRIVLFDSSPLLLTSESRILAALVGQVVIIVRAGETPQHAVQKAIGMIEEGKALNLVLNQVRKGTDEDYYGYGYGAGSRAHADVHEQEY